MSLLARLHERHHAQRRVVVVARHLAPLLPAQARLVDVGCGDGLLAREIEALRGDLRIVGVEVQMRDPAAIEVHSYDGQTLPFADASFDAAMASDVLHHAEDPQALLAEMLRVAPRCVLLKDHTRDGFLADSTLRLMDWVGNARHGVALPYHYWSRAQWEKAFAELEVEVEHWQQRLGLFPAPASWLFERSLHFVARLRRRDAGARAGPAPSEAEAATAARGRDADLPPKP